MTPPNDEDPIGSNIDPPSRWVWLSLAVAFVKGITDLNDTGHKLVVIGGSLASICALLLSTAGFQTPSPHELKPTEPQAIYKYELPFGIPGTPYGGDMGPITSIAPHPDDRKPRPKIAIAPKAKSSTTTASGGSAAPSPASNGLQKFLHAICPLWFPDSGESANT